MDTTPAYWKEIISNNKRRALWHDYRSRCIYMVTINKSESCPAFSSVSFEDTNNNVSLTLFKSGEIIADEIKITPNFNPQISILQYVIMPDHIHFLIFVKEPLQKHLGNIIQAIKSASTRKIRNIYNNPILTVFEEGFNDQILKPSRSLDIIYNYIRQNPYRLAVRKKYPDFFTRRNNIMVGESLCHAYGNLHLLQNPFKEHVIVHRADTPNQFERNKEIWLHTAANGGILVSPFISPREKEIRVMAEALGGRLILITNTPLAKREKPFAHDFDLCSQGRLLIITPQHPIVPFSRKTCLQMNALSAAISTS
ncbi:MAG: hypothetical protein HDR88_13050 [Bacteroides sp.]|nr:hypothetical protein [Bacteroides sp.]